MMNDRIQQQQLLIEEIGRHFDREGLQPVAGRILALLMVRDKEEMTFDEITQSLQISKSSASNGLKVLELRDVVEYVTYPGDRRRYFRVKTKDIFSMIDEFKAKMILMKQFNLRIMELKSDKSSRLCKFLADFNDMLGYFQSNFDELKKSYLNKSIEP
jgi:DNA-binding transcriptional regulator GbsR (MarR family)